MPHEARAVQAVLALSEPEEALEITRQKLADRPVLVEWHRAYQSLMEQLHPKYDLLAEYSRMSDAEKDNPTMLYLKARLTDDPAQANPLFYAAANSAPAEPYASHALFHYEMCMGNFESALRHARKAAAGNPMFRVDEKAALTALCRCDEAIALVRADKELSDDERLLEQLRLLHMKGDLAERKRVADTHALRFLGSQLVQQMNHAVAAEIAYLDKNETEYVKLLQRYEDLGSRFAAMVTARRFTEARRLLEQEKVSDPTLHLLVYIAASQSGQRELAGESLAAAMAGLAEGDKRLRQVGRWLVDERAPSAQAACALQIEPRTKCIVLIALAERFASERPKLLPMARKLNYQLDFPHLFLERALQRYDTVSAPPPAGARLTLEPRPGR